MAKRTTKAPRSVKGLPKGGKLYSSAARKTVSAMQKQYGQKKGTQVFYALANKRAGKGVTGKHRMHNVANTAYAKGNKFGFSGRRSGIGRRRVRG